MSARTRSTIAVLGALVGMGCRAPCPLPPAKGPTLSDNGAPAARVFPRLKELAGAWMAGEVPIVFEVIGKGAALAQRSGFYVVWHIDGEALAGSLFPDDGYHARLRSTKIEDTGPLVVEMRTVELGNVPPNGPPPLARSMTMTISPQNDRITQRWVFEGGTGDGAPVELVMTRAPESQPAVVPPPSE